MRKIDNKSIVGAFGAIMAVLVLCESAYGEEIVVNGPGNELGVDMGFECTGWYIRNCNFSHEACYRHFYVWMQLLSANW